MSVLAHKPDKSRACKPLDLQPVVFEFLAAHKEMSRITFSSKGESGLGLVHCCAF
jgi:hypothetical protein